MSLVQLEQANVLTISIVTSSPQGTNSPAPVIPPATTVNPGWVGTPNAAPISAMGWTVGVTGPLGTGLLKYSIKNEQGADIIVVDSLATDSQTGGTSLSLKSPDGAEVLRLVSSPGAQLTKLLLPSGESLGDLVVETKVKKDKNNHKDDEKHKEKKVKDDKKEKKDKDKVKAPKRQYLLRNPSGQESMKVSLKSKPKDMKLEMKIKSLQRKGEICTVESVGSTSSFQIMFKSGSVVIPNEKLYATGAIIGIVELERSQSINATGVVGQPL